MDSLLWPFMIIISWIMYGVHKCITFLGFPEGPSGAWPLSIFGLVVLVRILLLPLYNWQLRSMQGMQAVMPEIKKIQERYKGKKDAISRQRMMEETQAVYRDAGTSPFASCIPLLIQIPIFFSLFGVLKDLVLLENGTYPYGKIGPFTSKVASDILHSNLFGAPLSTTFINALKTHETWSAVVAAVLVIIMSTTQFLSMKYITMKNMTAPTGDDQQARMMNVVQKMMLYVVPVMLLFSGIAFPLGTVIYWFTNNLWTLGQQGHMVYYHPNKGTPAWEKKQERDRQKRIKRGLPAEEPKDAEEILENLPKGQRVQPVGKKRAKKMGIVNETNAEEIAKANAERELSAREKAEYLAAKQQVNMEILEKGKQISNDEFENLVQERVIKNRQVAKKKADAAKARSKKRRK